MFYEYKEGNKHPPTVNLKPLINKHNKAGNKNKPKTTRILWKTQVCE